VQAREKRGGRGRGKGGGWRVKKGGETRRKHQDYQLASRKDEAEPNGEVFQGTNSREGGTILSTTSPPVLTCLISPSGSGSFFQKKKERKDGGRPRRGIRGDNCKPTLPVSGCR